MAHAPLVIKPVEPDDKDGLTAAFERLSDESRYRRFLSPTPISAPPSRDVDHHDHEALVATDPVTGEGVGVARYVRDGGAPTAPRARACTSDVAVSLNALRALA